MLSTSGNKAYIMLWKEFMALWTLDLATAEDAVDAANCALEANIDCPALRELAGENPISISHITPLVNKVFFELGTKLPATNEAINVLALRWANDALSGVIPPNNASKLIWHHLYLNNPARGDLKIFGGLAGEWEDMNERYLMGESKVVKLIKQNLKRTIFELNFLASSLSGCPAQSAPPPPSRPAPGKQDDHGQ
jgi:hypothetical protein